MSTINTITKPLSIAPNGIPTVVRLSQNENGRQLVFELSEAVPGGSTVSLSGTKPDGIVYSTDGTVSGNTATFDEDIQLTAAAGCWDAKVIIVNSGDTVATGRIKFIIDPDTVSPGAIPSDSQLDGLIAQAEAYAEAASQYALGAPLVALSASDMTDHDQVYLYEGSEQGYTAGDYYYWSGSAWVSGGEYGAGGSMTIDTTISTSSHNPVENRAIGQALAVKIGYPARGGGVDYGSNGQVLAATGDASRIKWVNMATEPPHADSSTYGTVKVQKFGEPGTGLQLKFTYGNDTVDYVPRISGGEISTRLLPNATTGTKGAVILDTELTTQGKAADAKAVRDLIGDLANLDTTDKTNLVGAINEAAQSGGGGGGSVSPYDSDPADLGTASPGVSDDYARGDHVHNLPIAAQNTYGAIKMMFSGDAPGGYIQFTGNVGSNDSEMSLQAPRIESTGTIRNKYIPAATSGDYGGVKVSFSPGAVTLGYKSNGQEATTDLTPKAGTPTSASIDSSGLISFKNSSNNSLFTLQLPIYNGGVS